MYRDTNFAQYSTFFNWSVYIDSRSRSIYYHCMRSAISLSHSSNYSNKNERRIYIDKSFEWNIESKKELYEFFLNEWQLIYHETTSSRHLWVHYRWHERLIRIVKTVKWSTSKTASKTQRNNIDSSRRFRSHIFYTVWSHIKTTSFLSIFDASRIFHR